MKTCGIIIAKKNSIRFPGKNFHMVDGVPMFWHGVSVLKKFIPDNHLYVATDCEEIKIYSSQRGIRVIPRGPNVSDDEEPFFSVLKYAYQCLPESYDVIVSIAANSLYHDVDAIAHGLEIMKTQPEISEIRSFSDGGDQSGIFIFRHLVFEEPAMVLNHMAAVKSNGREIHYKEELS